MGLKRGFYNATQASVHKLLVKRSFMIQHLFVWVFSCTISLSAFYSVPSHAFQSEAPGSIAQLPRLKPPAPGPRYLTRADQKELKLILEAVSNKSWRTAKNAIERISDPQAKSLGQWYYYDGRDPNVSVQDGTTFLDNHNGWPSLSRIQTHLESELTDNTSTTTIYNLFNTRDPSTGNGKIHFIRTLMARGDTEAAKIYARDSWASHQFTSQDETKFLSRYGQFLTQKEHITRVDNMLWRRLVTVSRRTFSKLPSAERRKAEVRAAFYVRASNAQRLYNALSEADKNDAGVQHAAIRYFRRTDREERAIGLVQTLPDNTELLRNPSRFWQERNLLMRWALKNGRFSDAYAMANSTGLAEGLDLADAEFNAGWVALRFLNEPERAEQHFLSLAGWATSPISTARAYYWLGRAAKAQNKSTLAGERFRIAARYIYTYYGQLAAEEVGGILADQKFVSTAVLTDQATEKFDARPTALAIRMISDLNDSRSLLRFSYNLDDQLELPGEFLILAGITTGEGAPNLTIRAGKTAVRNQKFIPEVSYPLITVPDAASRFVPAELILGLSRQESEFNPRAFSSAGARGVMQLIPSTAQLTARKERLRYSRTALLTDPEYNMTIGSAHLSHLLERFDGSWIMTFTGYNAGPHRSDRWEQEYGDPRSVSVDPVDWVELIPFSETRNYVQRVLENVQIYRARLTGGPIAGQLRTDLERGGRTGRAANVNPPSTILAGLRPASDKRALPPLSVLTSDRIKQASINIPASRPSSSHLELSPSAPLASEFSPTPPISSTPPSTQENSTQPSSEAAMAFEESQPTPMPPVTQSTVISTTEQNVSPSQVQQAIPTPSIKPVSTKSDTAAGAPRGTIAIGPIQSPSVKPAKSTETPFDPYSVTISSETETGNEDVTTAENNDDQCSAYKDFIARHSENQNESSGDLNAAMLAQLKAQEACNESAD